jgi:hypothetical protein
MIDVLIGALGGFALMTFVKVIFEEGKEEGRREARRERKGD